ncbi:MAG TPA: AmmeMemoRadiSam system radical SAM enzyme [Planctomycetota bacterium]|nr:AmmeMemoRadiSam system radical SAM enzyme [Planctomycetota bacterium]
MDRRQFLQLTGCATMALVAQGRIVSAEPAKDTRREVAYYKKLDDGTVECLTCPKKCKVLNQGRGICGNKLNDDGFYYSLVYAKPCTTNIDPIEKKPLFHFLPGSQAYSLSTAGCNLGCSFCQNWQISQSKPEQLDSYNLTPKDIVEQAKKSEAKVIAFTYGEPIVFYEYMSDIASLARKSDIHSVMISNGYINPEPLTKLCKHLSAVKIDLKAFTEEFYRKYCNASLQPVLDTLLTLKKIGIWFEVVVLIIPTLNDSAKEIKAMCEWIKNNLGDSVPVHFSRFHPEYKLKNLPMTPVKTMEDSRQIACDAGLKFVYLGNIPSHSAESTYCPDCKKTIIKRTGYRIAENLVKAGKCPFCSALIPGYWNK